MLPETTTSRKPRRRIKYPGINTHAEALGVNRTHLYLVLEKKRTGASLTKRYAKLIAAEKRAERQAKKTGEAK